MVEVCRGLAACQQMSQLYSLCALAAFSLSEFAESLQPPWHFPKIGLSEVKLVDKNFKNAPRHFTTPGRERRSKLTWVVLCINQAQARTPSPSWGDPVGRFCFGAVASARLNETTRGVQVQGGRWKDIEVLIRVADLEAFCWSVLLKHHYCISLCKPYGSAAKPPHTLPQGVSCAFSLSFHITGTPTAAEVATRAEQRARQRSVWVAGIFGDVRRGH